jgi:hypothetical protein
LDAKFSDPVFQSTFHQPEEPSEWENNLIGRP